jgi:hypothetical protein
MNEFATEINLSGQPIHCYDSYEASDGTSFRFFTFPFRFKIKKAILKNKDGVFTYKRTNSSLNIVRMIARLQFCKCHHCLVV